MYVFYDKATMINTFKNDHYTEVPSNYIKNTVFHSSFSKESGKAGKGERLWTVWWLEEEFSEPSLLVCSVDTWWKGRIDQSKMDICRQPHPQQTQGSQQDFSSMQAQATEEESKKEEMVQAT